MKASSKYFFDPLISCHNIRRPVHWSEHFGRRAPLEVEIGFGLGEFLVHSAQIHSRRDYVGIEQNWERICKTLTKIQSSKRPNIRLIKIDARIAFERLFLPESIDYVHCLFPCPWPKEVHIKHRLFSGNFLRLLNSRLKSKGQIRIVTDFLPYREWILEEIKDVGFESSINTIGPCYDTKFERKWQSKGQEEFYEIVLTKTASFNMPVKKDTALKAYQIKTFNPQRFVFQNQAGDISVIFKEMLFDSIKNKAMVHLVVAEGLLTQHFWVSVMQKGKIWRVCKADGQSILPTPGIARAIELVYEALREQ